MELLEAEFCPGEQIVWHQQPRPAALIPGSMPMFFVGLPFFSFSAFVFYHLIVNRWSVVGLADSLPCCLVVLFASIGGAMLFSPFWAYRKALRTIYAITNQRCIILTAARKRMLRSYHVGWEVDDIAGVHRIEDNRGRGDLVFHRQAVGEKPGVYYYKDRFVGLQNVREVENKVRELVIRARQVRSDEFFSTLARREFEGENLLKKPNGKGVIWPLVFGTLIGGGMIAGTFHSRQPEGFLWIIRCFLRIWMVGWWRQYLKTLGRN